MNSKNRVKLIILAVFIIAAIFICRFSCNLFKYPPSSNRLDHAIILVCRFFCRLFPCYAPPPNRLEHPPEYILPREETRDSAPPLMTKDIVMNALYTFGYGASDNDIGYFRIPEKWKGELIRDEHYVSLLFGNNEDFYIFDWFNKNIKYLDKNGKIIRVFKPNNYNLLLCDDDNKDPRGFEMIDIGGNLAPRFDLNYKNIFLINTKGRYLKFNKHDNRIEKIDSEYCIAGKKFLKYIDKNELESLMKYAGLIVKDGGLITLNGGEWLADFDLDQSGSVYYLSYNNKMDEFTLLRVKSNEKEILARGRLGFNKQNFKTAKIYLIKGENTLYIIGLDNPEEKKWSCNGKIVRYDFEKKQIEQVLDCEKVDPEIFIKNIFVRGDSLITHDVLYTTRKYNIYEITK